MGGCQEGGKIVIIYSRCLEKTTIYGEACLHETLQAVGPVRHPSRVKTGADFKNGAALCA